MARRRLTIAHRKNISESLQAYHAGNQKRKAAGKLAAESRRNGMKAKLSKAIERVKRTGRTRAFQGGA